MHIRGSVFAFLLVCAAPLHAQRAEAGQGLRIAREYRQANEVQILTSFAELLAIPNVAADSAGIHANAEFLSARLRELGLTSEIWKIPGVPPAVYGELLVPGATRTLGIYIHYDGQPVDSTLWTHGPWEPVLYSGSMEAGGTRIEFPSPGQPVDPEWRIYARSAGDDKAPLGALLPVLRALREANVAPSSNLKIFLEGEEEAGSARLWDYLSMHRDRLQDIDVWLFFDGPVHQSGRPLLTFGVRGVTGMEITVYGATRSLHSGHYGNWAPVPGQDLARLLASMKDANGRVLIDGFLDTVEPIGADEQAALAALPDWDATLRRELGLGRTEGEPESLPERLLLPALTVRGLSSGNTGALARNVIPSTATATLGIRLVKGNDPEHMLDLVEAHIRAQGWHIVREEPDAETRLRHPRIARVVRDSGYPAARTRMDVPLVQEVIAAARAAAGDELVLQPALGGSLPLYLFTERLGKPAVIVPVANHDDNQHAPDENLRIANLWYAIDLYGALLTMQSRPASQ